MADDLRPLFDFGDLEASEARFRALLAEDGRGPSERGEVLTQLARIEGLRGRFAEADALLEEAARCEPGSARLLARIALERGRVRRSSGDPAAARPLFEAAVEGASGAGEAFIAVDAIHMVALVVPESEARLAWTRRGVQAAAASEDDAVRYWLGPLNNNLGWEHTEAGQHEQALAAFEAALESYSVNPGRADQIALARYAVGGALRRLGRSAEAVPLLEQAVAWADGSGAPDGWFCEELALEYADLGRADDASRVARRALDLLAEADPSLTSDSERRAELESLAG